MSVSRRKMEQDELEENLFLQSLGGQLQLLFNVIQSTAFYQTLLNLVCRVETFLLLLSLLTLVLSIAKFDNHSCVTGWWRSLSGNISFTPFVSYVGSKSSEASEWGEVAEFSAIFSLQGRRPNNEDRAVYKKISNPMLGEKTDTNPSHLYAVMDGHGGEFCAEYAKNNLINEFEGAIQRLKILTCEETSEVKLKMYIQHFKEVPDYLLKYLNISKSDYDLLLKRKTGEEKQKTPSQSDDKSHENEKDTEHQSDSDKTPPLRRDSLVLSSREKSIEEVPTLPSSMIMSPKTPKMSERTSTVRTPRSVVKKSSSSKKDHKSDNKGETPITEYISVGGVINYPKLIKDVVLNFDKKLLQAAKKENSIGGSTLILALVEGGQLWVGNVGDSRGVFCSDSGAAVPMSYDHKPCQLKEKKRIQEAGGFVAMNGVWRVQGVLATSRALGDYPLKDKKVLVADPDVLSFNLKDHRMEFAVLATDGLWDTHSNEEAVAVLRKHTRDRDGMLGASVLAREAVAKGSLDNVTVLVINLKKIKSV